MHPSEFLISSKVTVSREIFRCRGIAFMLVFLKAIVLITKPRFDVNRTYNRSI